MSGPASVPPPSEFVTLLELVTNPAEYKQRVDHLMRVKQDADKVIGEQLQLKGDLDEYKKALDAREVMLKELGDRLKVRGDGLENEKAELVRRLKLADSEKASWGLDRDKKVEELNLRERELAEREDRLRAKEELLSSHERELAAREEEHKERAEKLEGRWKAYEEAEVAARNRRADVARLAQEFGKQVSEVTR